MTVESISIVDFISYEESVPTVLDAVCLGDKLADEDQIMIKPNLIDSSAPPVTTPVECCRAVVEYIRRYSDAQIIIAEGCGAPNSETSEVFRSLGYTPMAERLDLELLDLNLAPTMKLTRDDCSFFPQMHLPKIAFESYIISLPVLKAHSLADITGTLKNMMGFAPPKYYQKGGHWKKSAFHQDVHRAIVELNRYLKPDFTLLDARVGLAEYHLGGPECDPPVNKLVAGDDPLQVDRQAAELLGMDWEKIPHLNCL